MRDGHGARVRTELMAGLDLSQMTMSELCGRCATVLSTTGAAIQLVANDEAGLVEASDLPTRRVEDLQFTLGEDPTLDAIGTRTAVVVPDFAEETGRWPAFAPAALRHGVHAATAIPPRVDAAQLGALTLYNAEPQVIDLSQADAAARAADVVTEIVLALSTDAARNGLAHTISEAAQHRGAVYQAAGIASVTPRLPPRRGPRTPARLCPRSRPADRRRGCRDHRAPPEGHVTGTATPNEPRERWLAKTFVQLADTGTDDRELARLPDLLTTRCVDLLDAAEVGLLLADPDDTLRATASLSERMHVIEGYEVQNEEGPCLDCYRSGEPVLNVSLHDAQRWPRFAPMARATGYHVVHALPMRHRDQVIGAVNVFHDTDRQLTAHDAELTQALADVATISILQGRALRDAASLADQLHHALRSRVHLEQAKGIVSESLRVDIERAFTLLRTYARNHSQQLGEIAWRIIEGKLMPTELWRPHRRQR